MGAAVTPTPRGRWQSGATSAGLILPETQFPRCYQAAGKHDHRPRTLAHGPEPRAPRAERLHQLTPTAVLEVPASLAPSASIPVRPSPNCSVLSLG